MRDDAPVPETVPRKRAELHRALDRWLAVWLARDDLTAAERRLVEAEKARRKEARPERVVGVVTAPEGLTPPQFIALCQLVREVGATEVLHTRVPRKTHGALMAVCRELGATARLVDDVRDPELAARAVIYDSTVVVAAPREATVQAYATPGVWKMIGLARHRGLPTTVVLPNGEVQANAD